MQRFWVRDSTLQSSLSNRADASSARHTNASEISASSVKSTYKRSAKDKRIIGKRIDLPTPDETWVLMPLLHKKDACRRCGKVFSIRDNSSDSCRFHADADGAPGRFGLLRDGNRMILKCMLMWWQALDHVRFRSGAVVRMNPQRLLDAACDHMCARNSCLTFVLKRSPLSASMMLT